MTEAVTAQEDLLSTRAHERQRQALEAALRRPRYEVLPLDGNAEQVGEHVPRDLPITVTASPRRGLDATLTLSETLSRNGFRVVPHLAARLVVDEAHLRECLRRIREAGIRGVFVIAGDGDPVGDFRDAVGLLSALRRLRDSGEGTRLEQVGIAGYPEGHPFVSDADLTRALITKQPLSTYVVSQMCFDAAAVSSWVMSMRRTGVTLPVHVGVPGAVDQLKLLRVAQRIGVRTSARFALKQRGLSRLLLPGGYRPDRLVPRLADDLADPARNVAGLHVYTLGDVAATERWRRRALERLGRGRHG